MTQRIVPDYLLMKVDKPARYTGNEWNMVKKDIKDIDIRFAFCFPDVYEVGMSHLGIQILYHFLNERADTYCERVFAPWPDMEKVMRENNIPLFAVESQEVIKKFDFIAFTLQYEMSYTNILNMIDLAGIPVYAKDRTEGDPIICAGGPCAYNSEPLADFMDFFYMGEGEVAYNEILDKYKEHKKNGGTRKQFLEKLLEIEGMYVPCFYDVKYKETGEIKEFLPNHPQAKTKIKKLIVKDMDKNYCIENPVVPFVQPVHDRVTVEVMRGCIRGCRFCSAGMVYRPVRAKKSDTLVKQISQQIKATGYEQVSLSSLSTSDYVEIKDLTEKLIEDFKGKNINISLPSLRIDDFSLDLMSKVQEVRRSNLTFAPEAGTQRMRDVINKGLTEEDILNGCRLAFSGGWEKVKLYFMIGLPGETEEDIKGIADLANKIVDTFYSVDRTQRGKTVTVTLSVACFVPKYATPFEWDAQNSCEMFEEKQKLIRQYLGRRKQIKYNYHDAKLSVLEGLIARGDRRIGEVIYNAYKLGCKFDAWEEYLSLEKWNEAIDKAGIDIKFYTERQREYDEILPWDHIDIGVTKQFLIRESQKSKEEEITSNCREKCSGCGVSSLDSDVKCDRI